MDIFQTVVLGTVQGLTEFIPVSSSGHLLLLGNLFGGNNLHLFVQALDFGTTLALIIFFRHRIAKLCRQIFIDHNYRLLRNIVLTCLPVATIGLLFSNFIESYPFFSSSLTVAVAMALVGIIMIILERIPRLPQVKDGDHLTPGRAVVIGLAQCVALIPGTSRSGSTIIAARLMGLKPREATEYSFMVSIPVMLGLLGKLLLTDTSYLATNWQPVLIANIFAFIAGMIAIKYLLDYLGKHSLKIFGIYRLVLASITIILLLSGILAN